METILSLSEQMLNNAREHEWHKLAICEKKRRQKLEDLFADNDRPGEDVLRIFFDQMLAIDDKIVVLGKADRKVFAEEIKKFKVNKKACQAYGMSRGV